MIGNLQRDFVGYGPTPPKAAWPNGARVAVNFVINYEEGSEYSVGDGDGRSEGALTEVSAARVPRGDRDLSAESMYEYGSRAGIWRVARQFTERGFPPRPSDALSRSSAIRSSLILYARTIGTCAATACAGLSIIFWTRKPSDG
jgi:hypothetical protein